MERAPQAVAVGATAAIVLCVGVLFEAGRRAYETIGPSKAVAARDGSLYVVSHGAIHVFDPAGRRTQRIELAALGASKLPSDFALHADGRALIADPDGSAVYRCRLPSGPCEALQFGLTRLPAQKALPLNSVKIYVDDASGRYYVSDNAGHRALIADFEARVLARTPKGSLWYPNQLSLTAPGELTVVDTNHRRLAVFDVTGDSLARPVRTLSLNASGIGRARHVWPFDAVKRPGGETWALLGNDGMKDADLIAFDAHGIARRRVDLGDDSDPFDIEPWQGVVVVADAMRYRLQAVTATDEVRPAVADAGFEDELRAERARFEGWKLAGTAARVGVVLAPAVAIFLLWRMGVPLGVLRRPPSLLPFEGEPAPLSARPHWLDADPAFLEASRRSLRKGIIAASLVSIGGVALLYATFAQAMQENPDLALRAAALLLFPLAMMLVAPLGDRGIDKAAREHRLGAASDGMHYAVPPLRARVARMPAQGVVPWTDVYFDGRKLLFGRLSLLIKPPMSRLPRFEAAGFQRWIVAHIPEPNRMSPMRMSLVELRRSFGRRSL